MGYLTLRLARAIARDGLTGEDLWHRIAVTRIWIQVIGMLSIFVTALWGMYQNLLVHASLWLTPPQRRVAHAR